MKIAIYSTQVIPSNPNLDEYGGLELVAGLQAKYFDDNGHDVSLFGCFNSYFNNEDHQNKVCSDRSHLYAVGPKETNPIMAWKAYWDDPRSRKALTEADIVCDHSWGYYPYSKFKELKLCHVWHGPDPGFRTMPPYEKPNFIAVGFNHARVMMKMAKGTHWRTVQNSIPLWKYNYNDKPISERERLLWISRIYYPKGCHRAIKIADKLQMPIDICGGSFGQIPEYEAYVKGLCEKSSYANWLGPVDFNKKLELYQNAKCVILPVIETISENDAQLYMKHGAWEWHEPFGLITPEANACGTPVIVTSSTGWNESMIHGTNGFFANTDEEFIYFIKQINDIKPAECRKIAEKFDYKIMGERYLHLFKEILETGGW